MPHRSPEGEAIPRFKAIPAGDGSRIGLYSGPQVSPSVKIDTIRCCLGARANLDGARLCLTSVQGDPGDKATPRLDRPERCVLMPGEASLFWPELHEELLQQDGRRPHQGLHACSYALDSVT